MLLSTESLLTSLLLRLPASSRTSPSRFPRMLVEYQPSKPSIRAFNPGAMIDFIHVWPVLKSLPAMGTPLSSASLVRAGMSTASDGAPLAYEIGRAHV